MRLVLIAVFSMVSLSLSYTQDFLDPGISAGTETWLGVPRGTIAHTYYSDKVDLTFSGSGSIFFLFYFNYAVTANNEIKYKIWTLDSSFGFAHYPEITSDDIDDPIGPYKQLTLTPKVGMSFNHFDFKIGISKLLYTSYADGPAIYIGNFTNGILWNFEFSFKNLGQ